MSFLPRPLGLALCAAALVCCGCSGELSGPREKTSGESVAVEVNAKAPAFAAKTLEGEPVRLADYVGRHVVLLEFWSIFCRSCIQEMPHIEALHREYAEKGLTVLSINTDVFSVRKIQSFLAKAGIEPPYPVVRDARQEVVKAYEVELLPVTVIIDREGWIRLYQEGYRPGDEDRFESVVRRLLRAGEADDVTLAAQGGVTAFAPAGAALVPEGAQVAGVPGRSLAGQEVSLDGRPHLLFFWSLYCKPCREEYPEFVRLAREYAGQGLDVFSVNVDSEKMLARVKRFAQAHESLPCLMDDPTLGEGSLAKAAGVRATPTVVLVGADGAVVHAESGSADVSVLEGKIRGLLSRE